MFVYSTIAIFWNGAADNSRTAPAPVLILASTGGGLGVLQLGGCDFLAGKYKLSNLVSLLFFFTFEDSDCLNRVVGMAESYSNTTFPESLPRNVSV